MKGGEAISNKSTVGSVYGAFVSFRGWPETLVPVEKGGVIAASLVGGLPHDLACAAH